MVEPGREHADIENGPIRLLVVEDHPVMLKGLVSVFDTFSDIEVVGQALSGTQALAEARLQQPDVVLTDVRLPDMTGIEVCKHVRAERPETQVVVLTAFRDVETILGAVAAGAIGFVLKSTPLERVAEAVQLARVHESYLDPVAATVLVSFARRAAVSAIGGHRLKLDRAEQNILSRLSDLTRETSIAEALPYVEHVGRPRWRDPDKPRPSAGTSDGLEPPPAH